MTPFTFYCIVEGEGEVQALPVLLRRLFPFALVPRPSRQSRDKLMQDEAFLRRQVERGVESLDGRPGALVLLLDADDDCPATEGPRMTGVVKEAARDYPCVVALASREYESWFVAAAGSLAGSRNVTSGILTPAEPEKIRGAKEWLTDRMPPGYSYSPTTDQPAFSQLFDIEEAMRNAASFRRFVKLLTGTLPSWV